MDGISLIASCFKVVQRVQQAAGFQRFLWDYPGIQCPRFERIPFQPCAPSMLSVICVSTKLSNRSLHPERRWANIVRNSWTLCYSEESMTKQKYCNRGFLDLTEKLHVFSMTNLEIEKRKRAHFAGSTHALTILDIPLPDHEMKWRVSQAEKQTFLGPSGKTLGPTRCATLGAIFRPLGFAF